MQLFQPFLFLEFPIHAELAGEAALLAGPTLGVNLVYACFSRCSSWVSSPSWQVSRSIDFWKVVSR